MQIKAIETAYNGYRFRSRLEARWAVFFDALGIEYQYEPEGFDLGKDGLYLPDFYLPTFHGGLWAEVKFLGGDFSKPKAFAMGDGKPLIWLCEGQPAFAAYRVLYGCWGEEPMDSNGVFNYESGGPIVNLHETDSWCGIPNWWSAQGEDRMYMLTTRGCEVEYLCEAASGSRCCTPTPQPFVIPRNGEWGPGKAYQSAVIAAKQARFEHGETPTVEYIKGLSNAK